MCPSVGVGGLSTYSGYVCWKVPSLAVGVSRKTDQLVFGFGRLRFR